MDASACRLANDLDLGGREPTASSGPGRRSRPGLGRIAAELLRFPKPSSLQVRVRAGEIVLLTPLAGRIELADEAPARGAKISVTPGAAALLGRAGAFNLAAVAGASGLLLRLPRDELQVAISRRRNQPARLAAIDLVAPAPSALLDVLSDVARTVATEAPFVDAATPELRSRLEATLLEAFLGEASWGALLQTPRAVSRAVCAIRDGSVFDPDLLAALSGVTPRTLREGFATVFGMSLAAYLQRARLERARQSLASGYDSRSIPQVAKDCGFSTASAFSRAYVRAFDEAPTETRARAVRAAPPTARWRSALG